MKHDSVVRASLLLLTSVVVLAALYFSRAIIAPVTFALFTVAIAWPLQSALQKRITKLLAVVVTIIVTIAILAILVFLVVWGFGLVVQWLINNTDRLQTLYSQATEWLDGHGISIATLVADNYSPGWVTCGRRLGKNFLTFCSIGRVRSRVRPVDAADVAAGPNALRGSGPNR